MQNAELDVQSRSALDKSRKEQYLNLTPVQVIYKLLDIAVQNCKKEERTIAVRALNELILALNFEHQEVALGLFRLYDYSKQCIHNGEFSKAITVLEDLRSVWGRAFHLREAA